MIFEGDTSVIDAIKEKKRLMDAGEEYGHIKILCVVDGGLMKGAYSAGTGLALEELGYTNVFSDLVGVSSGAPSVAYFLGGNVTDGSSLIYDECCSKEFFNPWRFWSPANLDFLVAVLKGKTGKAILPERIFNSSTRLHIGVSDYETTKPVLIKPSNQSDLFAAIKASTLMPSLTGASAYLKSRRFVDGGFAAPHILHEALTAIEFTHVLILTNQNHGEEKVSWVETLLNATVFRLRTTKLMRKAMMNRRKARRNALDILDARTEVKSLVIWGDNSIHGTERDSEKVKAVVEKSRNWWLELMKK